MGRSVAPRYEITPYDYVIELKAFSAPLFRDGLLESARSRRKTFLDGHPGLKRQSVAEWLDGYPFSQAPDNTAWVAERRLLPVRLPAMDRRLLGLGLPDTHEFESRGAALHEHGASYLWQGRRYSRRE